MLHIVLVFLVVGVIGGALGLVWIAATAGQPPWVLFLIGLMLIVGHLAAGRRPPIG